MSLRTKWKPGDRFLVRHKDAGLLVVEKKAGVLTVPTRSGRGEDLMSLVERFVAGGGRRERIFPVHRLDRPVSGLLVIARRPDAQQGLIAQFATHSVERRYIAAVRGLLPDDSGTFESYMRVRDGSLRMESDPEDQGRRAVTHWRVLERFEAANATLIEVTLETGLRNQIRVHFSEAGFPLLGEKKYLELEEDDASLAQGASRIFLHAAVLGFVHPLSKQRMRFEAPLPPDLAAWKRSLEAGFTSRPKPRSRPRSRSSPRRGRPTRSRKSRAGGP